MKQGTKTEKNARCTTHLRTRWTFTSTIPFWRFPFFQLLEEPRKKIPLAPLNFLSAVLILHVFVISFRVSAVAFFHIYILHEDMDDGRRTRTNQNKFKEPLAKLTNHQQLLPYPIMLCLNKRPHHKQNNEKIAIIFNVYSTYLIVIIFNIYSAYNIA